MWAALATMVVGILGAVAQTDIRRILSFTLVSHIGYMVFGIALATTAGLAGAIFYVVHHIAIQTTLFLVAGLVERQGGSTSVDRLGGLAKASPLLAVLYFVPAMNLAGIPPFSGFIGKLGLLEAGVADGGWLPLVLVAGGVLTSLLTLVAISRVWNRAFWRPPTQAPAGDSCAATAADAGPDDVDADAVTVGADSSSDGTRPTARQAAWQRHTAVATDTMLAEDGTDENAGSVRERPLRPLPRVMVGATAGMVVVTVALTALAGPLYGVAERAAQDLLDRTPYISAVLDGSGGAP
jgi:multicomponent Na+:H+ antiporter subunit D